MTADHVRKLLNYNPETGALTWKATGSGRRMNKLAGGIGGGGYLRVGIYGKKQQSHRVAWLIMKGCWPVETDHINGIRTDNRWVNLREVTRAENSRNQKIHSTNTSGHIGVTWNKAKKKWKVQTIVNGRNIHGGYFGSLDDAVKRRKEMDKQYNFHPNHGKTLDKKS